MTETADQILSHVVPVCQWVLQISLNPSSTAGQFSMNPTKTQPLRIEKDTEDRFNNNILSPVDTILETQGAIFHRRCPGLLDVFDFVLGTNDSTVAKMPMEMKTRFNLNLCGHNLWTIYQLCNGLHYSIISNYSDTYFLKQEETNQTTLYVSRVIQPNDANLTLRECIYYISQLAINDNAGERLDHIKSDNISSNGFDDDADDTDNSSDDNPDDSDYTDDGSSDNHDDDYPSKKMKQSSKKTGRKKVVASSSKGITTIGKYIGGETFGNVFSGYYHGQAVAWKTCDAHKEKEAEKTLRIEANMYSILKKCQVLQLIEDARHIDPANLTVEEKRTIVQQLETIHSYGVLHNDIAQRNILMEPKSRQFFFIDFGLSNKDVYSKIFFQTFAIKLYKLISDMQDQRDKPKDLSELDLLRQRIIDLETENVEFPNLGINC
ncbi:hypothetical protein Glove_194g15 [Diversispora epigaea]|uniref:Uncharacterized protein n=1 Tax=Diversispora epigaea TaxID=1348612 RepID=A0A397IQW4_9GLOM|nr:hypothetical protein Glove_194g15 [Diversispora epigaea]